jgi:hypothetical protein
MKRADGMALLAVVAATAALASLVAVVSLSAAASAATAGYRAQRTQAEWLIEGAVRQAAEALAVAAVALPIHAPRRVCDGIDVATGAGLPIGRFPGSVPGWGRQAAGDAPHRVCVELAVVRGPAGEVRGDTGVDDGTVLVEASVQAWHGHAHVLRGARLVVHAAGAYRLH